MNFHLKEAILKRGLKQKFIAKAINLDPVIFSKKLIGDLSFTKSEQVQLCKMLRESVKNIFQNTKSK